MPIMKRLSLAGLTLLFGATVAFAQGDAVAERIEAMKKTGDATKVMSNMMKES